MDEHIKTGKALLKQNITLDKLKGHMNKLHTHISKSGFKNNLKNNKSLTAHLTTLKGRINKDRKFKNLKSLKSHPLFSKF